jgi:hypothetical protein
MRDFAMVDTEGHGSLVKSILPPRIACAIPGSVSENKQYPLASPSYLRYGVRIDI